MKDKTIGPFFVPLVFVVVIVMAAMISAGGIDPFLDGLGLRKKVNLLTPIFPRGGARLVMQTTAATDFVIGALVAWRMRGEGFGVPVMTGVISELIAKRPSPTEPASIWRRSSPASMRGDDDQRKCARSHCGRMKKDLDSAAALHEMERQTGFAQPNGAVVSIVVGAITAWREDRGGGCNGMQAVLNVLHNRAIVHKTSVYTEATRPMQFSAMTAPHDPELTLWPAPGDENFKDALELAVKAQAGGLEDITNGAVSYYATSMKTPPYWAATMTRTAQIGGQIYFKLEGATN